MQKHWANTLKSLVPNGYRELNLSSKGKTPRPWLKLAPAPDTHTHAYTLKKSQKSKTRFTNFIINFDRNQITKYLKSQQSTQQTHTHTQIGRSADIRSVRDNLSTVFFISFNDFLVVPIQTTPNKSSSDSMALETSTRTNFFYSDKFTWQWVATKPGQPVEVRPSTGAGRQIAGQRDSGTEAASKPGPKHGRWPQQPHP